MDKKNMITLSDIDEYFGPLLRVGEGGKLIPLEYEEMKKFDLDLKFGHFGEDFVRDMQKGNTKIEVKTERDKWKSTGNIAIEIRYNGEPSGLSTTGSEVWIHLLSYNGKIEAGFIFNVDDLKEKVSRLYKEKKAKLVMGGDFDGSQIILLPIKELF
tara:strand:+ start:2594 stop:3061 length:468 start_codon:yes stop_codon:yes gene_type:complete